MAKKPKDIELTEMQEKFVELFIGECQFDPIASYKGAGYKKAYNAYSAAMRVLNSEAVKLAIHTRLQDSTIWIQEEAVINRLWNEGLNASNASARINALVWVGKHIGMWREKVQEEQQTVYQVVNYGVPVEQMMKTIEEVPQIEEKKDDVVLPEGVTVLKFNKEPV